MVDFFGKLSIHADWENDGSRNWRGKRKLFPWMSKAFRGGNINC